MARSRIAKPADPRAMDVGGDRANEFQPPGVTPTAQARQLSFVAHNVEDH
jgi:hypothetical protein